MIKAIFCQEPYPCLERLMRIFSDQNDKVKEPLRQLAIAVAAVAYLLSFVPFLLFITFICVIHREVR